MYTHEHNGNGDCDNMRILCNQLCNDNNVISEVIYMINNNNNNNNNQQQLYLRRVTRYSELINLWPSIKLQQKVLK